MLAGEQGTIIMKIIKTVERLDIVNKSFCYWYVNFSSFCTYRKNRDNMDGRYGLWV